MSTFEGTRATESRSLSKDAIAAVGTRIGALVIDGILFAVVFVVVGLVTGGGHSGHGSAGVHMTGGPLVAFLAIWFAYFTICEATSGQTLGKRLSGIKVVGEDGATPSWGQSAGRNLLRLIDALPAFYIVGLISVIATGEGRRQRVGDVAARTYVVQA
jgi:uncharacterized RDD family membrane protein YckC